MSASSPSGLLGRVSRLLMTLVLVLSLASSLTTTRTMVHAVKFDLVASHNPQQRCIWNYAMADTLVVIT